MKNPFVIVTLRTGKEFRINLKKITCYTAEESMTSVYLADSEDPLVVDMNLGNFEAMIESFFGGVIVDANQI